MHAWTHDFNARLLAQLLALGSGGVEEALDLVNGRHGIRQRPHGLGQHHQRQAEDVEERPVGRR